MLLAACCCCIQSYDATHVLDCGEGQDQSHLRPKLEQCVESAWNWQHVAANQRNNQAAAKEGDRDCNLRLCQARTHKVGNK